LKGPLYRAEADHVAGHARALVARDHDDRHAGGERADLPERGDARAGASRPIHVPGRFVSRREQSAGQALASDADLRHPTNVVTRS
jgi:hypothetical protein